MVPGVTLYHGTSTLFLDSIKENGLGAVNPVEKFRLHELLVFLANECERRTPNDPGFNQIKYTTYAMLNQDPLYRHPNDEKQRLLNFRHGATYLAAMEKGAVLYACQNRLGSELLSTCASLVSVLLTNKEPVNVPVELNGIDLQSVLNTEHLPILVEAQNVPLSSLNTEHGMSAEFAFNHLQSEDPTLTIEGFTRVVGVFELTQPIPSWALRYRRVMCQANITDASFSYRLNEIS